MTKSGVVALEIEHWVLEEPEVSFSMSPRARNGHKIGGFLFEAAKLLVVRFADDAVERAVWHLRADGLRGDSVGHGSRGD